MNILVVCDEESKRLWDYYQPGMLDKYELILSLGDLDPEYLSFLVTMGRAPVLYVHGNHDDKYEKHPPEGCVCIEDKIYNFKGIRILGLGGSMKYKPGKNMYTIKEMDWRVKKLFFKLKKNKGFDILITHAPAYQVNDGKDLPHMGFPAFNNLIKKYHPTYFLHGHIHQSYGSGFKREDVYEGTKVINCCGMYELNIPDEMIKG